MTWAGFRYCFGSPPFISFCLTKAFFWRTIIGWLARDRLWLIKQFKKSKEAEMTWRLKEFAAKIAVFFVNIARAFFGVKEGEGRKGWIRGILSATIRRIVYYISDYWLSALSAVLVIGMRSYGFSFLLIFLAVWLYDYVVAATFVWIREKSGIDFTLAEAFRNAVDAAFKKSRTAGMVMLVTFLFRASVWEGPEQAVIFFRPELRTRLRRELVLALLTAVQGVFWTVVYGAGHESVLALWKTFF